MNEAKAFFKKAFRFPNILFAFLIALSSLLGIIGLSALTFDPTRTLFANAHIFAQHSEQPEIVISADFDYSTHEEEWLSFANDFSSENKFYQKSTYFSCTNVKLFGEEQWDVPLLDVDYLKRDNSINATNLVKLAYPSSGSYQDAFYPAGSTGMYVVVSENLAKRIAGVDDPALALNHPFQCTIHGEQMEVKIGGIYQTSIISYVFKNVLMNYYFEDAIYFHRCQATISIPRDHFYVTLGEKQEHNLSVYNDIQFFQSIVGGTTYVSKESKTGQVLVSGISLAELSGFWKQPAFIVYAIMFPLLSIGGYAASIFLFRKRFPVPKHKFITLFFFGILLPVAALWPIKYVTIGDVLVPVFSRVSAWIIIPTGIILIVLSIWEFVRSTPKYESDYTESLKKHRYKI